MDNATTPREVCKLCGLYLQFYPKGPSGFCSALCRDVWEAEKALAYRDVA